MTKPDLYGVLGIGRDADEAAVRSAYRARAKDAHPDAGGSEERFQAVNDAHLVLSDPAKRKHYDATGEWDEGKPDDPDQRAWSLIGEGLMGIVQGSGDPVITDLVAHMAACFDARIAEVSKRLKPQEKALARTRKLKGRFKNRKKKTNRIEKMLDWQVAALEQAIRPLHEIIADLKRAQELVRDYDFESDTPPSQMTRVHFTSSTASTF